MGSKAMYKLTYGLFVLSVKDENKDTGCIINTAMQLTSEPNRIAICVNKLNYTNEVLQRSNTFALSVLTEKTPFSVFENFGFRSGKDCEKFADIKYNKTSAGIAYPERYVNAVIQAEVFSRTDMGSHTLFVADVTDMLDISDENSLSYEYYHKNIKPSKKPVEAKTGKVVYRCSICGFEYEGDVLPDDYVCPICKHPASDFERVEI